MDRWIYGGQEEMMTSIDNFLRINFEISLETYFRLTDSKLKKMLQTEIKNFLEEQ